VKYLPFIELRLKHTYYTNERCPDFEIEPTPDTHQLLKNYRCVFKTLPDGMRILIAVTENKDKFVPLIPLQTGLNFSFYLRLQNPDFPLFTDIAKTQCSSEGKAAWQLYLSCPSKALRSDILVADIELNNAPLEITDAFGEFEIQFQAKKAKWKYYLITDNPSRKFSIIKNKDGFLVFEAETDTCSDSIAQMLKSQYPNMNMFCFMSSSLIPCQQQGRESIGLNLNNSTVLKNLPNPSLRNYATMETDQSKSSQKEEVLFQVIKYLTKRDLEQGD
jgi:hypothetical protein